jgi:hypothetical protein
MRPNSYGTYMDMISFQQGMQRSKTRRHLVLAPPKNDANHGWQWDSTKHESVHFNVHRVFVACCCEVVVDLDYEYVCSNRSGAYNNINI